MNFSVARTCAAHEETFHFPMSGSRYLALQRHAREQERTTAELLQLYVLKNFLATAAAAAATRTFPPER